MREMTIGKLAKASEIGIETIRFYEREGLLKKPIRKLGSGYRQYDDDALKRIKFIKKAKYLGFTLKEIKEFLSLRSKPGSKCSSIKNRANTKMNDVEKKIVDLIKIKGALAELLGRCNADAPTSDCPILAAFEEVSEKKT